MEKTENILSYKNEIEKFLAYAKRHRYVPRDYFCAEQVEKITGVYYPFWVTDADSSAAMTAEGTRIRTWIVGNVKYTETTRLEFEREGEIHFEDIVTSALSTEDKEMLEGVLPYPSESLQEFSMPYLSGYLADKYDVDSETSITRANERIKKSTEETFRSYVKGYESVTTENSSVNLQNGCAKYALYPVWLLNTTWRGKKYSFAMNGQTGKLVGDLPMDKGAYKRYFFIATVVGTAAALALQYLMWLL